MYPDGSVVMAVLYDYDGDKTKNNPALAPITKKLRYIEKFDSEVPFDEDLNLRALLPKDLATFYWYKGSLTTPPCSEELTWIVFPEVQEISKWQLEAFEFELENEENKVLGSTARQVMPLNDRLVKISNDQHCTNDDDDSGGESVKFEKEFIPVIVLAPKNLAELNDRDNDQNNNDNNGDDQEDQDEEETKSTTTTTTSTTTTTTTTTTTEPPSTTEDDEDDVEIDIDIDDDDDDEEDNDEEEDEDENKSDENDGDDDGGDEDDHHDSDQNDKGKNDKSGKVEKIKNEIEDVDDDDDEGFGGKMSSMFNGFFGRRRRQVNPRILIG